MSTIRALFSPSCVLISVLKLSISLDNEYTELLKSYQVEPCSISALSHLVDDKPVLQYLLLVQNQKENEMKYLSGRAWVSSPSNDE